MSSWILFLFLNAAMADVVVQYPEDHSTARRDCAAILAPADPSPPESHAGFLRNIGTNPTDDMARLVYADWLDEHGQPELAEFIRRQIRELVPSSRQMELLNRNFQQWIPQRIAGWYWNYRFRRGFIEEITMQLEEENTSRLPDLFAQIPTLRFVHFATRRTETQESLIKSLRATFTGGVHLYRGERQIFLERDPAALFDMNFPRSSMFQGGGSRRFVELVLMREQAGEIRIESQGERIPHLLFGLLDSEGRLIRVSLSNELGIAVFPANEVPNGYSIRFLGG